MSAYGKTGNVLATLYALNSDALQYAYDINGVQIFSSDGEDEFIKTTLAYDTNWFITTAWLENAVIQRNRVKAIYQQSEDAIPFFIQTDGHGRYNEGNKGCHNLAEPVMRYIPNMQLGDYGSYYSDGNNPANHTRTSAGIENYLPAMGNHEFMKSTAEGSLIADLPTLIAAYTPSDGILGSQTYGYYKVYDDKYNIKYLVGQAHIPDVNNSSGFVYKATSDQFQWFIDELATNDGYDVIVLNHEPFPGTYYNVATEATYSYGRTTFNLAPILADRKAKRSGTYTDTDNVIHSYDFTECTSDLLCTLHGHIHKILTKDKEEYGYPSFVGRDMTNNGDCAYGIIDRAGEKMYIFTFGKNYANDALILDL